MKIAISNIAWDPDEREEVAGVLAELSIDGVEVAPTKIWPDPTAVDEEEIAAYRRWWKERGIEIVATQSLLFGRQDLVIFEDAETRERTKAYLGGMVRVSAQLGAAAMVFGSPRTRRREKTSNDEAMAIAADFFAELGEVAHAAGTAFCIEANPPEYGADFIVSTDEAAALVRLVDHPGFRLHIDASTMTINGESYEDGLKSAAEVVAHFHISEPHLELVDGSGPTDHERLARSLRSSGYDRRVSIEMRNGLTASNVDAVRRALEFVVPIYGSS